MDQHKEQATGNNGEYLSYKRNRHCYRISYCLEKPKFMEKWINFDFTVTHWMLLSELPSLPNEEHEGET